ncbi:hypothetical protein Tco_0318388 [Tanacetum coccineum]
MEGDAEDGEVGKDERLGVYIFGVRMKAWSYQGEVLELIIEDRPRHGLHLNVDKSEVVWLKEDPRSKLAGVFPPNISQTLHDVKLLSGPDSVDFDFSSELVMKRVAKSIELMDVVGKINDAYYELLLLLAYAGIYKLYFAMRICSPRVFERAQRSFDAALHSALERIITTYGLGFDDVLNYTFLSFKLQSASLQTKLLQHADIVTSRPSFDNALCTFNARMEIDLLSTPSEIVTPKL